MVAFASTAGASLEPQAEPARQRRSARWCVLVFAATLGFYLLWVPRFLRYSNPPTGDQPFYLMDVASLAQDRDLNVKNNYDDLDFDKFYALARVAGHVGVPAPYPPLRQLAPNTIRPPEEQYSHHMPGLPILLFPAWKIGGWFGTWWPGTIVAMCALSALLAVNVHLFAMQVSSSRAAAVAVWLAISFSTPVLVYSYLIFTELCVGLLVLYAVRRLSLGWRANEWDRLLVVGLCIAYIPWVAWRCVLLSATLTAYALWQWWSDARTLEGAVDSAEKQRRPRDRRVLLILIPVLASAALILRYHYFLYGKPFPDAQVPELAYVSPFHWPWQSGAELVKFLTNACGLLFDKTFGLLPWAPVYALAIAGAVVLHRSANPPVRRLVPSLVAVTAPYLVVLTAFHFWNGQWTPPARYLTSLVPLAAAPLGAFLAGGARRWQRAACLLLFVSLAVPGWLQAGVLLHDARLMWPIAPSTALGWLSSRTTSFSSLDLQRWVPGFIFPDENRLPYLLLGWVAACIVLAFVGSALSSKRHGALSRAVVAWSGALALVGGASTWVAYPYLKHKTELYEQGRWTLGVALENPRGIAHHDGKIYVACYGPAPGAETKNGRILEFDLTTGESRTMPLIDDGVALAWDSPGGIELGPDGLLYVLNNGPADRALLAVRPDGEVVRRFTTPGSTLVAAGLALQGQSVAYVTDTAAGALRRYLLPSAGGTPEVTTVLDGLNNPSAVAVDGEGRLYVNEGFTWIRQLDADGKLLRKLERCSARSFTALRPPSPWIEASCDQSLFSIDTSKSELRFARVRTGGALEGLITALTYGSDGLLYTLQGGTLVAYRAEH